MFRRAAAVALVALVQSHSAFAGEKQGLFYAEQHCMMCEAIIFEGLKSLGGVASVRSVNETVVRVTYDDAKLKPADIVNRLNQVGYPSYVVGE